MSIYDGNGTLISKTDYAYNSAGQPAVETNYSADGSIKEQKTNEWSESGGLVSHTKLMREGIETSVNSNNFSTRHVRSSEPKRSVWTTNKPDGSRTENIFEVDASGTHHDQQINYGLDGTVTGRRVSIVDAGITRLEATEYDGAGNITSRTLQTREYDSHHNLNKIVEFRWNAEGQEFEPVFITYHMIVYR
jgi:YD repeat-containing protein